MALKTQGFTLSALPRAPQVPGNVGKIDVKEIYDGVRRGLDSFELARTAGPRMALADAEIAAKTAEAPLGTRGLLAETEAKEVQLPIRTALLAAEASPEMQEAKRQALINRSTKQAAGDVQFLTFVDGLRKRVEEDPTDARAQQLLANAEAIAANKGAASLRDPQGAIDQRRDASAATNETRRDVATAGNEVRRDLAGATNEIAREKLAQDATLRREGFGSAQDVAKIGAAGRVDAARAANTAKLYEVAAADNQRLQSSLASLAVIEDKIDAYKDSALGSGPVVGSDPALFVRNLFGDASGQQLKAAVAQEMANAVQTIRGLGAMSDTEFKAVMDQLPRTTDVGDALDTKLDYMKALRPWLAARSNMYLSEIERGTPSIAAHERVRRAFPMPGVAGTTPVAPQTPVAPSPVPVVVPTPAPAAVVPVPTAELSLEERLRKYP